MNRNLSAAIIAVGLVAATFSTSGAAGAAGAASMTLNLGDVAFGYNDGYWDHAHQWHAWKNHDDLQRYKTAQNSQYHDWRHTRDSDQGWKQQ